MKVCFIGLGSIAKRHIRNLKQLYGEKVCIDVLRSGHGRAVTKEMEQNIAHVYCRFSDPAEKYDAVFITNPTRLHYETLQKVHHLSNHFFIEKPVFETGKEDLKSLHLKEEDIYYVACPMRYMKVIRYLKQTVDFSSVYSIRCISSSYLPKWREGVDYRQTYSAKKELGGGVAIDLIHEWDYINYLAGEPLKIKSFQCKKSDLEIDSDDVAVYIAEYGNKVVELHLDYFGRVPVRKIELIGRDDTIEADLLEKKVEFKKANKVLTFYEDRDSYQIRELEYFFRLISGKEKNENTIERACRTLEMARGEYE